jgi:hypothetical protein
MAEIRTRKSSLGWCVLAGSVVLGLIGALTPQPSDLNIVSGAIYGLLLGAIGGVLIDRLGVRA